MNTALTCILFPRFTSAAAVLSCQAKVWIHPRLSKIHRGDEKTPSVLEQHSLYPASEQSSLRWKTHIKVFWPLQKCP